MKREKLKCEKARDFSILSVLEKSGHFPVRQSEKEAWFLSPLRSETQASFKVSLSLNRWYDFGEGKGGNVIDLVVLLKGYSVAEALAFLNGETSSFSFHQPPVKDTPPSKITIQRVKEIQHPGLVNYLHQRNIAKKSIIPVEQNLFLRSDCKTVLMAGNSVIHFSKVQPPLKIFVLLRIMKTI